MRKIIHWLSDGQGNFWQKIKCLIFGHNLKPINSGGSYKRCVNNCCNNLF